MRRFLPWRLAAVIVLVSTAIILTAFRPSSTIRAEPPAAPEPPFTVPPGYVVERVAGPPLVEHPMFACFDDRGRLYVADSGGKNLKAEDLLKDPPSCIRVLEDTNGDGVFDTSKVFADKMVFPMGVLWHQGHVYSCSHPSLWRLTDTNGDGVADERKELVTKFGSSGNGADIHGPWLSPDGWLYWSDGRHGHEIKRPDGTVMKGKAARIFRCKIDGTSVEVVCGGGMDDPVQIAFTEEGEPFTVVDIFKARPTRQDALIYCIDGGVFPYYEAVLGEFKKTGPLLPAVSELGWVAPSGLIRYRSDHLGKEFTDTLLSTQFNTHKIVRHKLTRVGAGFTSKDEEFITSTSADFHPTSLVEDADGSLLVIDTGGWFRIGCPQSQVAKPEIKGGIYRVRRKDAAKVEDARGLKIPWGRMPLKDVATLLADPRPVVRDRAVGELSRWSDESAISVMAKATREGETARERINAVWALCRAETSISLEPIMERLTKDQDARVRQVAARALGLQREGRSGRVFVRACVDGDDGVRREAVIAFARCSAEDPNTVLSALRPTSDPFLNHAVIHALIQIAQPFQTSAYLFRTPHHTRRAVLIALDQMKAGGLNAKVVSLFLTYQDPGVQRAAWDIMLARPAWLTEATEHIRKQLQGELSTQQRESLREGLAAACRSLNVEMFVAEALADNSTSEAGRLLLLDVVASADSSKPPPSLITALKSQLRRPEPAVVHQTVRAIRAREISDCDDALEALLAADSTPADIKLGALAVVAPRRKELTGPLFDLAAGCWKDETQLAVRLTAAETLSKAKLDHDQLLAVAAILPRASALELPRLLDVFKQSASLKIGRELVANLGKASALASVPPGDLREALAKFPAEVRTSAEPLFKKFAVDEAAQRKKLAEFAGFSDKADANRGRLVFFGKKSLCSACHAVKGEGERIGPDLTKIGSIRSETDLLESMLFPSNSIARGYESFTAHTTDGKSTSGVIRRETADAVYLVTQDRTEVRLPRARIESLEASRTSVMPQGLEAPLSRQELGDLIAFLRSLK